MLPQQSTPTKIMKKALYSSSGWTDMFPQNGLAKPRVSAPICLSMEVVALRADQNVCMEVDDDCWQSTRDYRPAGQALPKPMIKYYYYYII